MADFSVSLRAKELGKSLENLSDDLVSELEAAIGNMANMAFASIQAFAQTDLHSTRQDYLKGLHFDKLGKNSYLIWLEGDWPNALEEGFSGYDLKDWMLRSEKVVGIGPRTGEKWVQQGKKGNFAHVPFQKQPFSKVAVSQDMNEAIRKLTAINRQGLEQKFTKMFKDASGNPLEGRVASVSKVEGFPELAGITKYQYKSTNESGKDTFQSHYMVFRTISEGSGGWQHPGYKGLKAFEDAEKWIDTELDNIINSIVK